MRELLKFEFHKLFRAKVLYICAIVLFLLVILFAGIDKLSSMGLESLGITISEDELSQDMYSIMGIGFTVNSGLTRMLSALSNVYVIILFGAFISVFVCGDFGNGVIKNIFTRGYSRTEVFFAKYIVTLAASFGYGLLTFLAGFLTGTVFWKVGSGWEIKVLGLLALQLLVIAAYNAFFNFLAAWLKRLGLALALSIAIPIILPMILMLIELLAELSFSLSDYWLAGCLDAASRLNAQSQDLALAAGLSAAYIAVCTFLGWLLSRKREV